MKTEYNKSGEKTHSEIAEELKISIALSHKIEGDIFLKFSLALFNPDWVVKNSELRHLYTTKGEPIRFQEVGEYYDFLANEVESVLHSNEGTEFQKAVEKRIVEISKHVEFRKAIYELLTDELDFEGTKENESLQHLSYVGA